MQCGIHMSWKPRVFQKGTEKLYNGKMGMITYITVKQSFSATRINKREWSRQNPAARQMSLQKDFLWMGAVAFVETEDSFMNSSNKA